MGVRVVPIGEHRGFGELGSHIVLNWEFGESEVDDGGVVD